MEEAKFIASEIMGDKFLDDFNLLQGVKPQTTDPVEQYLNQTWRCSVGYTGAAGLPDLSKAGNVLRKETELKLAVRLPPKVDSAKALEKFIEIVTKDPPYGAEVTIHDTMNGNGWAAQPLEHWLQETLDKSSTAFFGEGNDCKSFGEGGSIPFVNELGDLYPKTQILVMGVGGNDTNPHNPNENIDLDYAKTLLKCISYILGRCSED